MYSLKPPRRNQTRKGEKSLSLKMVTVRKKMMDGEKMKLKLKKVRNNGKRICRKRDGFFPEMPNSSLYNQIPLLKKLKTKFQKN